jgi:hypothetical protein
MKKLFLFRLSRGGIHTHVVDYAKVYFTLMYGFLYLIVIGI